MLRRPSSLYRALATAEMVTWALLLLGMASKYLLKMGDMGVRVGGGIHGFVFLAYVVVTLLVATDQRWRAKDLALGLGSAVLPFATLPFERSAEHRGLLGDGWRLRGEEPRGSKERVVAWALRRSVPAVLVALVLVSLVFGGLLLLGPPGTWFK